jgi:hypothetical protein
MDEATIDLMDGRNRDKDWQSQAERVIREENEMISGWMTRPTLERLFRRKGKGQA